MRGAQLKKGGQMIGDLTLKALMAAFALAGSTACTSDPEDPVPEATPGCGVVVYDLNSDGSLDGVWTWSSFNGRVGDERATGGTPGQIPGEYDVDVLLDAKNLCSGKLTIEEPNSGGVYRFKWACDNGDSYSGLGFTAGDGHLAANYWKD